MASSEAAPLTLVNIALDLQIIICIFLHPSDILALRKTCKALQLSTRQRVVWLAALHRICFDNTLFLPSFPIPDMSNAELEQAAIAPRRWIEHCATPQKQHSNNTGTKLCPRTTRFLEDPLAVVADYTPNLFIVPGGRYLVSYWPNGISVWDLGYTSSADCKLIASVGPKGGSYSCEVHATSDGMGLTIFSCRPNEHCSVYEIYPQSETPQLTQIAYLDFDPSRAAYLLPDRVIWYRSYGDRIVFTVWDYRMNYSISFSADLEVKEIHKLRVMATKTAIIVLCEEEVLVWAIPLLSPQSPDFSDHNATHIPSLFRIAFPDGIAHQIELGEWKSLSSWYFGSSQPLYFDILWTKSYGGSQLHRFEIIVKPDLSDASLHARHTCEPTHDLDGAFFSTYSICEDTLVGCWVSINPKRGIFPGSRVAKLISAPHGRPATKMLLPATGQGAGYYGASLCPASGKFAHLDRKIGRIVVVDFF